MHSPNKLEQELHFAEWYHGMQPRDELNYLRWLKAILLARILSGVGSQTNGNHQTK